jgi:hypothetical protein
MIKVSTTISKMSIDEVRALLNFAKKLEKL